MIALTQEMRDAFDSAYAEGAPVLIATASKSGLPDMAYKGSAIIWDDDHIAFWERAHGMTLRNMEENPGVCVLFANLKARLSWKYFGEARLVRGGELRDAVMARTPAFELDRDPERKGIAVIVRVDKVLQRGQVIQSREG